MQRFFVVVAFVTMALFARVLVKDMHDIVRASPRSEVSVIEPQSKKFFLPVVSKQPQPRERPRIFGHGDYITNLEVGFYEISRANCTYPLDPLVIYNGTTLRMGDYADYSIVNVIADRTQVFLTVEFLAKFARDHPGEVLQHQLFYMDISC